MPNLVASVQMFFFLDVNKATIIRKTGPLTTDSLVIISSVSKAVQNRKHYLPTLLMMTAEAMLPKRPVLRIIAALFFF